jgi:glucose-6-phosphate 1-dehydrogenase
MTPRSDSLVLFGATGDLARRKLFSALYRLEARGVLDMPVVGVARTDWTTEQFRAHAASCVHETVPDAKRAVVTRLTKRLEYVSGDYDQPDTFARIATALQAKGARRPTSYLAIAPAAFPTVVTGLAAASLNVEARVVVEKPFGRDLKSARDLNSVLAAHFSESQIFRIDHYLGKEAVEDLLVFRFANTFLEPIWNRNYVASVQVTMAESFGVEDRGEFYEQVGALRDVVQNHLLQVVAFLAMEPPVGPDADHLRNERAKVLSAIRPLDCTAVVRGQYDGYRDEAGVGSDSTVETYLACRLEIDSWRWAGVPFFIRAAKAMPATALEALVELRPPPRLLLADAGTPQPPANIIRFRLGANDGVTMTVQAKTPGQGLESESVDLSVDFASALGTRREPYERLLDDALDGNARRFARSDAVEEAWRIVQPVLDAPGPVHGYERGSWGPTAADTLLQNGAHWHDPQYT